MVWSSVHPDAPTDDDGRPIHPEQGFPICAYEKTDATANNGRKREDIDYCLLKAGWGGPREEGHCRKHGGGGPGGLEGWANGNAKHLLYSERMNDDDRKIFESVVQASDGELVSVDRMADMLSKTIGWEFTRLTRALAEIPEARLVERWHCPECGDSKYDESGECENVVYRDRDTGVEATCGYSGDFEPSDKFVDFGDKAVERKESHLANLIRVYKQVADGTTVNVHGDHDVTHRGDPDAPVEVNISHVQVDLPDDERVTTDVDD